MVQSAIGYSFSLSAIRFIFGVASGRRSSGMPVGLFYRRQRLPLALRPGWSWIDCRSWDYPENQGLAPECRKMGR